MTTRREMTEVWNGESRVFSLRHSLSRSVKYSFGSRGYPNICEFFSFSKCLYIYFGQGKSKLSHPIDLLGVESLIQKLLVHISTIFWSRGQPVAQNGVTIPSYRLSYPKLRETWRVSAGKKQHSDRMVSRWRSCNSVTLWRSVQQKSRLGQFEVHFAFTVTHF